MNEPKTNQINPGKILGEKVFVINVGLKIFEEALKLQEVQVISVHFRPPHKPPQDLQAILSKIL